MIEEYKVEQNQKYGDYRVSEYRNGEWCNEVDGFNSKAAAQRFCDQRNMFAIRNDDEPVAGQAGEDGEPSEGVY